MRSHAAAGWGESKGCIRGLVRERCQRLHRNSSEIQGVRTARVFQMALVAHIGVLDEELGELSQSSTETGDLVIDSRTWRRG